MAFYKIEFPIWITQVTDRTGRERVLSDSYPVGEVLTFVVEADNASVAKTIVELIFAQELRLGLVGPDR
jgi:hypothetical protein